MHQAAVICILACALCAAAHSLNSTTSYGYYCNVARGSADDPIPYDELDEACQVWAICTDARGSADCFCNEQAYYTISNVVPHGDDATSFKIAILHSLYIKIAGCADWAPLGGMHVVPGGVLIPGFAPIYQKRSGNDGWRIWAEGSDMYYYLTDRDGYVYTEVSLKTIDKLTPLGVTMVDVTYGDHVGIVLVNLGITSNFVHTKPILPQLARSPVSDEAILIAFMSAFGAVAVGMSAFVIVLLLRRKASYIPLPTSEGGAVPMASLPT